MKCPHCGIYYMDGERECPVCGKRCGITAPKKTSRPVNPKLDLPYQPKQKKSSGESTARKQTYNNASQSTQAAWQQAAAGQHTHDNPLEPKKKKAGCGCGCLIVVILLVIISAISIIGAISFRTIVNTDNPTDSIDPFWEEDGYVDIAPSDVLTGTWRSSDNAMTITVDADDTEPLPTPEEQKA